MVSARRVSGGWALLLVVLALASVATQVHGASWARARFQQVLNPTPSSSSPSTAAVANTCPLPKPVRFDVKQYTDPASKVLKDLRATLPPTPQCKERYHQSQVRLMLAFAWQEIVGAFARTPEATKTYHQVSHFVDANLEFVGAASHGCASKESADPNGPAGLFQLTKAQFDASKVDGLPDDRKNAISSAFAFANFQLGCRGPNPGKPLGKTDAATLPLKLDFAGWTNPFGPSAVKPAVSTPPVVPITPIAPPPSKTAAAAA